MTLSFALTNNIIGLRKRERESVVYSIYTRNMPTLECIKKAK